MSITYTQVYIKLCDYKKNVKIGFKRKENGSSIICSNVRGRWYSLVTNIQTFWESYKLPLNIKIERQMILPTL